MKNILPFLTACFTILTSLSFGQTADSASSKIILCNTEEKAIENVIRMDWVRADQKIIEKTINKLPEMGSTLQGIKKLVPHFLEEGNNSSFTTSELGYNLEYGQHKIYGGYGSCRIEIIYYKKQVIELKLTIENHKEIIEDYLADIIQLPFECVNGQLSFEKTFEENWQSYSDEFGELFLQSADTNARRKMAIDYFTDVTSEAMFAEEFYVPYWNGSEIFGHINYFIHNQDYDALKSILFSPNPTGRLFAARALVYMEDKYRYVPDEKTIVRMREALLSAEPIRTGVISCWANQMNFTYYDVVLNFEKYLGYH